MQARQPGNHDDESPGVDLLGGRAVAAPIGRAPEVDGRGVGPRGRNGRDTQRGDHRVEGEALAQVVGMV